MQTLEATPSSPGRLQPAVRVSGLHKTVVVGFRRRKVAILKGVDLEVARARCSACWAPTAPARPPRSRSCSASCAPRAARSRSASTAWASSATCPRTPTSTTTSPGASSCVLRAPVLARRPRVRRARQAILATSASSAPPACSLRKFSKGMLQRIGIAQALINDPGFVLLDEPMTGLDPVGRVEVKRIIEGLHERGTTVLFNSHILADVAALCTRIAIMREGRVAWQGAVDEALDAAPQRSRASSWRW